MTEHTHTTLVEGCFRCELNKDEMRAIAEENAKICETVMRRVLRSAELTKNDITDHTDYVLNAGPIQLQQNEYDILCSLQDEELDEAEKEAEPTEEEHKSLLAEIEELLGLSGDQLTDAMAEVKRGVETAKRIIANVREAVETKA